MDSSEADGCWVPRGVRGGGMWGAKGGFVLRGSLKLVLVVVANCHEKKKKKKWRSLIAGYLEAGDGRSFIRASGI